MWRTAKRLFDQCMPGMTRRVITMASAAPQSRRLCLEVALGPRACSWPSSAVDGALVGGFCPEHIRAVVRFCARRRLPVDLWWVSGLWRLPEGPEAAARWVGQLAGEARPADLGISTRRMPLHFDCRLVGHLRRFGWDIERRQ